jgi:outer membrane protein OmpA-like peptidoglycan-associated protein
MKLFFFLLLSLLFNQLQAQSIDTTIIHFGFDKFTLTPASKEQLMNLLKDTQAIASVKIKIHGHCDSSGPSTYNDRLSVQRVEAVHRFLLSKGFADSNIIEKKGHGEKIPINKNATKEQRSLNRRVDLVVQTFGFGTTLTVDQILSGYKISSGDKIVLKNINFIGGYHLFVNESLPALNELLKVMKSHPKMVIRIEGHICCGPLNEGDGLDLGTEIKNLSIARAKAVQEFLENNGIEASRMNSTGFGHTTPIYPYPEQTKEEELANRRVEIVIVSM